jgi:hypothetical protein
VKHSFSDPSQLAQLRRFAHALDGLRDSLVMTSLTLTDLMTKAP